MKKLMNLAFQYKVLLLLFLVFSMGIALTVVAQSIVIAKILSQVLAYHASVNMLTLVILLVVLLLRASLNALNLMVGNKMSMKVKKFIRSRLIATRSEYSLGSEMSIVTESVDGIAPFYQDYLPQVFKSMMVPFFIIIAMLFLHLNTALIMIVTAPFIPLFYIVFGLRTRDEARDKMTYLNQFSQRLFNKVKGLVTLKLLNQTDRSLKEVYEESTRFRSITMRILKSAFLSGLMLEFISMLGIGLVALEVGLGLIIFHNVSFETAMISILLAPEFYNAIKDLGQSFHTGKQSEGASEVVFERLEQSEEPNSRTMNIDTSQSALINFSEVSFAYPNSSKAVLQGITLTIKRGERVALVGPSGAGKTTFAQLIAQHFQPTKGEIIYKYPDIKIGELSQQPYIFNATIRDNVTMFKHLSDSQIYQALDEVGLKEKVLSYNNGLDTLIGEEGEMLSGGEMRRLELTRVLLEQPDLVILDEPSTGLDIETEEFIHRAIETRFSNSTVVIIAHRHSTLRLANKHVHLEDNHITSIEHRASLSISKGGASNEVTY
ncbi:ABC transporter ATP-binding protein/permease [Staphylococcus sp. SQ8-PEA]|uniref:ABC transporter ATP-binding protein/permease n=1 Tax=Staphylococcus marylandisciuri TaxID=2981529 RepID=A0ABT2QP89_9STAP|nr:ABC transporter ATP-binding protein/permease [Staphylococcus marylandisciuri]MCU5745782.1 ABC transporter ATP-binding protein/permease [Staphylococcus marylandisciuri]